MGFDINASEAIELTAKLGKLHRSALPVAVRGTLNDAAFETKRKIPEIASRKFTTRNRSFFRAFSSVNTARGFDINSMSSQVGINSAKGTQVAEGLEKQETGGAIKGRKLIPMDTGRTSNSHNKRVRRANRFSNISNIVDVRKKRSGKASKYILIKKGSKGTVFEVKRSGKRSKLVPIYYYRSTRISKVKASPFMAPSSYYASSKMPEFYLKQAEKQIKRLMK